MLQDDVFKDYEGNHWFQRNKAVLDSKQENDVMINLIEQLSLRADHIAEVGCSNGWRLEKLRKEYYPAAHFVGFDISKEAIEDGGRKYPAINLCQAALSEMPTAEKFDLVICNFVLHWVDRSSLLSSITNIDKIVNEGGCILIGDFYPDFNQKKKYHHLPEKNIYTYKQDYAKIFQSLGIYKEVMRVQFNHDKHNGQIEYSPSNERGVCVALRKMKDDDFYPEV